MANPTSLPTGDPGSVEVTTVSQTIALSSEVAWDVVHTGYNSAGDPIQVPVWLAINETSVAAATGSKVVFLPPNQVYTFPLGTRNLAYIHAGALNPILTLISSREGLK